MYVNALTWITGIGAAQASSRQFRLHEWYEWILGECEYLKLIVFLAAKKSKDATVQKISGYSTTAGMLNICKSLLQLPS